MFANQGRTLAFSLAGKQSVRYSSGKLKELSIRIRSITNIQKITKTMNMISAAKYAKSSKQLAACRAFGYAGSHAVTSMTSAEGYASPTGDHLVIMCSSDRGLCGALHTNLARAGKEMLDVDGSSKAVCIGEKNRVAINSMGLTPQILLSCKEFGRNNPTFSDAGTVAQAILESDFDWKAGSVLYNYHKTAMTQEIKAINLASTGGLETMPGMEAYDSVDEDVLQSFSEFALASSMYGAIKENYVSEQAARMIAMDGASKNATDMIDRMKLRYNRLRQAVITTELCEIIAGMAAL